MSAHRDPAGPRCLHVTPRPRGGWTILTAQNVVISEHLTASEAQMAALKRLREGDEVILHDRYHRCHRIRRTTARTTASRPRRS